MVFTRSKQTEDDANQIAEVDKACDSMSVQVRDNSITSATVVNSTANMVITSAHNQEKVSAKYPVSKPTANEPRKTGQASSPKRKLKVDGDGDDDGDSVPQSKTELTVSRSRRVRSRTTSQDNKRIKIEDDEDNGNDYIPETSVASPASQVSKVRSRQRRSATIDLGDSQVYKENIVEDGDSEYDPGTQTTAPTRGFSAHTRILRPRGAGAVVRTYGVLTICVNPKGLAKILKKIETKRMVAFRKQNPPTNRYKFAFGISHVSYHEKPSTTDIDRVARILEDDRLNVLAQFGDKTATPAHSGQVFTMDAIVRVIVSQACTNEAALDAQQSMIYAYPYYVDGVKVIGTKPNYHLMRVQSVAKLSKVLMKAGLYTLKAGPIKKILDMVYEANLSLLSPEEIVYRGNEPNARDFVPGLLSLDYFGGIYQKGGRQAVFDQLVAFPQVGVKTACCLMAFHMGLPVFAVDTHVAKMAKLLQWVPRDATENEMCSHLDSRMLDDDQKLSLHQDFWRHRRSCARCSGRAPNSWAYQNTVCPLEHLITRRVQPNNVTASTPRTQTSPAKRVAKKEPDAEEMKAKGMVQVTYQVDDDFDAAASGEATMRTVWIEDFSMLEADVQMVQEEKEDVNEFEITSETIRQYLRLRELN